jgi:hypothetical protein
VTLVAVREAVLGLRDVDADLIKSSRMNVAAQLLELDKAADVFITEHESSWRAAMYALQ